MKIAVRLAFVLPALLAVAPASAETPPKAHQKPAIRYVTLDKLIRKFAEEARTQQAARPEPRQAIIAQR